MKAGALLSLLLCFVALAHGLELFTNPEMDGCLVSLGAPATDWTGPEGSYAHDDYSYFFISGAIPAGDTCFVYMYPDPSYNTLAQTVTVTTPGTYDLSGLFSCNDYNGGAVACSYTLSIDGQDVPISGSPIPATYPTSYQTVTSTGIQLTSGPHDVLVTLTNAFGDREEFFISKMSLVLVAASSGDPHMVGFQGQQFDYIGEPGQVVNLVTDPDLQLNTLLGLQKNGENSFIPGPVMMELAFMTRGHTVMINAGGYQKEETGFVTVDGVLLPLGHSFLDGLLSVVFTALNTNSKDLGLTGNDHIVGQVEVKLESLFEFRVFMIENGKDNLHHTKWVTNYPRRFLDFNASLLDLDRRPHGVLGQTAAPLSKERSVGEWTIEGKDQDYVVKDGITGSQFAFNQF